ncbi:MAG: hypothetical protein ACO3EZ_14210 [Prochlorotrichaceae cyanobacterium]|jgi:hypothetical protein
MELNNSVNISNVNESANEPEQADSLDNRSRDLLVRHHQNARKREQTMMVRLGEEVGLPPEVAGKYGSEIQGKMPHDFSGYDRSGASSS